MGIEMRMVNVVKDLTDPETRVAHAAENLNSLGARLGLRLVSVLERDEDGGLYCSVTSPSGEPLVTIYCEGGEVRAFGELVEDETLLVAVLAS